jgi:hypothetical protein
MSSSKPIPSADDLLRAEKQVLAGIYGRLLARYIIRFGEHYASSLALAVTKLLLCQKEEDKNALIFTEQNQDQIMQEITALSVDKDLRRIVTDTLVLKAVYQHRLKGCKKDESNKSIERLKELGIYLEGKEPPTPSSYVRMASRFFSETPLRGPVPQSSV